MIFTDADNTLWDTNAVYATAQLALLEEVERAVGITAPSAERLAFVRAVDQELATIHHGGLRYPPSFLATALALVLKGTKPPGAARRAWKGSRPEYAAELEPEELGRRFVERLTLTPPLRPGVKIGLQRLSQSGHKVTVVTEGHKKKCAGLLKGYGLEDCVISVIEAPKRPELFRRLSKMERPKTVGFMIGDQLDRDILPAKQAGLVTIYFPGGFQPKWMPSRTEARPDYSISSFEEVFDIIGQYEAHENRPLAAAT